VEPAVVRKTFKYKLLPTNEQEQRMAFVLRRCRELYNAALQERRDAWQKCHTSITCAHQSTELPAVKEVRPEYHDVHSQVLQDVLTRLDHAFQAFFRRVENGEQPGYPRFQGANRYASFTYKQFGNGATLDNGCLVLSKIGQIAVKWSRPLEGTVKTVTITHEADGWYCCFSCTDVPMEPLPPTGRETGIDVGLKVFLITAEGEFVENPRHYRRSERDLKKAQRRVARRKKGSKRRKKAAHLLAKKHQHIRRQRTDFHHKTALGLVRRYDTIYLEDLQVANLSRRPAPKPDGNGGYLHNGASQKAGLNKSINDAGWAQFRTILEGKAAYAGRRVVAVPPAYTSQDCSGCGERVEKSLSVRTHVCPSCGLILDRDENAARNIQWAGQALAGTRGRSSGVELRSISRIYAGECQ
jgi:putative transposase